MQTPETVARQLYRLVSFDAGRSPDWDAVKGLFLEEAVVVLRTSPAASSVLSLQGFVDDFMQFIERRNVLATGFSETVLNLRTSAFGDIAHVLVLYEACIPGSGRPPQRGVDSLQMVRATGSWRIASIANDIVTTENPVPPELEP